MAEILTYQFFPTEDIDATYTEGSTVDVYWDTVAEDFKVYVDDAVQANGPDFRVGIVTNVNQRNYRYSFCVGDDLHEAVRNGLSFIPFPYMKIEITENSPTCTGNTCDLVINSVDVVTDTGSGGEIVINASSTATEILYSIGGAFSAGNTFTDVPGDITYTVVAKDSNGCRFETPVYLAKNIGYSTKYEAELTTINGVEKFEIQELNYEGASEEVCIAERRAGVNYPNQSFESIYDYVIQPSNATIALLSESNEKFIEFYSKSHKEWRVIYSIDGAEKWRGYIVPSEYSEPYLSAPYATEISFTDGLKLLENIDAESTLISGKNNIIKILAGLLSYTDLELPINVSIEVYSEGMNTSLSTLQQTAVDFESAINRASNAYETLEEILRPFGCVLLQQDGAWWVVRQEKRASSFDYYIFDTNGNPSGTGTYNGVLSWSCPTDNEVVSVNKDQQFDIMPAFGRIVINNEFDLKPSLLNNWNFEKKGFSTEFTSWTFVKNGSNCSFTSVETPEGNSAQFNWSIFTGDSINDAYIVSTPSQIRWKNGDKVKLSFKIAYDKINSAFPFVIVKAKLKLGDDYLQPDGTWDTAATDLRFYPSVSGGFTDLDIEAILPENTSITQESIQVFIYASRAEEAEIISDVSFTELKALSTTDRQIGYKTSIAFTPGTIVDEFYELVEGTADVVPDDYNVSTNNKQWQRIPVPFQTFTLLEALQKQSTFIVDNVEVDYLPDGFEPVEEQETTYILDQRNPEQHEFTLKYGTLPYDFELLDELTPNDRFNYSSQFSSIFSGKAFLDNWGRKGIEESSRLQFFYSDTLINQHNTPSYRITGTFSNKNFYGGSSYSRISPRDCLFNTYDSKFYIIVSCSYNVPQETVNLELVEIKVSADGTIPDLRVHNETHNESHN